MSFVGQPPEIGQPVWISSGLQVCIFKGLAVMHFRADFRRGYSARLREPISRLSPQRGFCGVRQTARRLFYRRPTLPRLSLKEVEWRLEAALDGTNGGRNPRKS